MSCSNQCQCWLFLLIALELGMHHIKFEKFSAVQDVVHIFFAQWDDKFVVAALPVRVAAGIDDIRLEVFVLGDDAWHVRSAETYVGVRRLHFVDWVEETHG